MLTHITRGRAVVTVTEFGRGRSWLIALAVAAVLAIGAGARYARTAREAAIISVDIAFGVILAAVITMTALLARRIYRGTRGYRAATAAPPAVPMAARAAEPVSPAPARHALPAAPVITVRPEWIIASDPAPRGRQS